MEAMREKNKSKVPFGPVRFATRWVAALLIMLLMGCALGLGSMTVFDTAFALIRFIWVECWNASGLPFFPLLPSVIAGGVLSLIVAKYGKPIRPMEALSDAADTVDGLEAISPGVKSGPSEGKRPLPVRLLDFLTPFAGGGPVGVAMGVISLVTSGCAWVKRKMMRTCERLRLIDGAEELSGRKRAVLYCFGVIGGILGVGAVADLLGVGMVIPRVQAAGFSLTLSLFAVALSAVGWALGLLYLISAKLAKLLWDKAGRLRSILPLLCGAALGLSMILFPHAGLPGSDAFSYQLLGQWHEISPASLLVTALLRTMLIAFLLNLGWSGGPFLPLVYSALCFGLGISGLLGIDAGVCVAAAVSGILVSFSGQPLMGVAAFMCCPLESLPIIAVSTVVATVLPRPKGLKGEFATPSKRGSGGSKHTKAERKQ